MRSKLTPTAALVVALMLTAGCRSGTNDSPPPDRDATATPPAIAAASPEANTPVASANIQPSPEGIGAAEPSREPAGGGDANVNAAPVPSNPVAAASRFASRSWRILSVSGEWAIEGDESRPLARGDTLRPRSLVRLKPAQGQREYIVVVDQSGHTKRLECEPVEECTRGWTVPDVPVAKSTLAHVIDTALDLLSRDPKVYINPISRGGGVREAVLLFEEEGTDLRPALGRLTPAKHTLEIAPIERAAAPGAKPVALEFRWDARKPAPVRAAGLRPGLYSLTLDRSTGGGAADAWVVVSAPASYRKTSARFREALAVTEGWGDTVDGDVARGFLRAYLEHLAARGARD